MRNLLRHWLSNISRILLLTHHFIWRILSLFLHHFSSFFSSLISLLLSYKTCLKVYNHLNYLCVIVKIISLAAFTDVSYTFCLNYVTLYFQRRFWVILGTQIVQVLVKAQSHITRLYFYTHKFQLVQSYLHISITHLSRNISLLTFNA